MKSILSTPLMVCALLMTMGTFLSASRAMAQESGAAASNPLQQEGAQDKTSSPNASGDWQASWTAANGDQRQATMQIKQKASKLSGTFTGPRGSASLKGSIKGNQISLTMRSQERHVSFTGTLDGNKMSGTTKQGVPWTATRQQ